MRKYQIIKVVYAPPPSEVVMAVKNADKPRITIVYPNRGNDEN